MKLGKKDVYIFSYILNFLISAFVDISIYTAILFLLNVILGMNISLTIIISIIIARILSSLLNFFLNKRLFYGKEDNKNKNRNFLLKYYSLWFFILINSVTLNYALNKIFKINAIIGKIFVDCFLGLFSFFIQKTVVFKKNNNKKTKGLYFRIVRFFVKLFLKKNVLIDKDLFKKSTVFVGHHQNFYAPIIALIYLPDTTHIWAIGHLFTFKECFDKYYNYTFIQKINIPKPIAFLGASICAILIPTFLKSANAIPVYRSSQKIINTFKISMDILNKNEQIVIFPDIEYDNTSNEIGEIYNGFLSLEKLYFKKNKEHLSFVPLIFDKQNNKILNSKSIYFSDMISYKDDRDRIVSEIINIINKK